MATSEEILAPYAEMLAAEQAANARMLELNKLTGKPLNRYQKKRLEALAAIEAWLEELVANNGSIQKCGEIPRVQWAADNGFLSGWLGKDIRPRILVVLPDGSPFRAAPISSFVNDPQHILAGGIDPSGTYYQPYNRVLKKGTIATFPCWNSAQLRPVPSTDLNLIRNFDLSRGALRTDPRNWESRYRQAWFEGHPGYKFPG